MNDATSPAIAERRPILITGGAGFIGSNLADRLASEGHDVLVFDSLAREGVEGNLRWLRKRHPQRVSAIIADIRDGDALARASADCSAVFHFAAQVAVTTSLSDPQADFAINLQATVQLLEAMRRNGGDVPLVFASTNKVYGDLGDVALEQQGDAWLPRDPELRRSGIGEDRPLEFHTPYGCSKGAADQYVLDFARSFGMPAAVLRMSCIYGQRQMGTEDQGWVAHFLLRALHGEPISIFGDGCQVRDVLDVRDAVCAYMAAWRRIGTVRGRAFNLGGGPANAISLRQLIARIEALTGEPVVTHHEDWRAGDQRYYVSDTRRAAAALRLPTPRSWQDGVSDLAQWLRAHDRAREAA